VEHHQRKLAQRLTRRQEERRSKEFRAQVRMLTVSSSECCQRCGTRDTFLRMCIFLQSDCSLCL
jgi:hypothetical protein